MLAGIAFFFSFDELTVRSVITIHAKNWAAQFLRGMQTDSGLQ